MKLIKNLKKTEGAELETLSSRNELKAASGGGSPLQ